MQVASGAVPPRRGPRHLGAPSLMVNVIMLWNTIPVDAALAQPRAERSAVRDEEVARPSPAGYGHVNVPS